MYIVRLPNDHGHFSCFLLFSTNCVIIYTKYFGWLTEKDTKNNDNVSFSYKLSLTASMNVTLKTIKLNVSVDVTMHCLNMS